MNWKCHHCGGTTGTYWSRMEPMDDVCKDCGKGIREPRRRQIPQKTHKTPKKMTNNSTESNKNPDSAFNNNMTTTDTPRTDAAIELYGEKPFMTPAVPVEFAEKLERELAEANRLLKVVLRECQRGAVVLTEEGMESIKKAEKAEAELAELWSRFDDQMQAEQEAQNLKLICDEQQAKLEFWGEEIEELRLEVIAAQESEAVWKTEADKADQRRLEAEAEVENYKKLATELVKELIAKCNDPTY